MFGALTGPVLPLSKADEKLIRSAREAGYHVHYLKPSEMAYTAASVMGNRPLPALAVLRKGE